MARESPDGVTTAARDVADAVERLTSLWSSDARQAAPRLSRHQLRALRTLEAAPGLNVTALARRLDIGQPTASRLCDRLEAAGLLERALHPHRRREVRLHLTGRARRVLGDIARRRAGALAAVLDGMGPQDRAALREGLRAFSAALDGPAAPGPGARRRDPDVSAGGSRRSVRSGAAGGATGGAGPAARAVGAGDRPGRACPGRWWVGEGT